MKVKIFFLPLFIICFAINDIMAQKNEISFGNAYFNNGNIFSGLELNYYRNIDARYALGVRSSLQFNNDDIRPEDHKRWSASLIGRIQTSSTKKLRTFIESGFSYFRIRQERFVPTRPEQSLVGLRTGILNYGGITLGLSIDFLLSKRFRLGINYRSYLLFPYQVETKLSKKLESFPVTTLNYIF